DDVAPPVRLRRDPYDAVHETHPFLDADQPQATGLRTHGLQVEPDPFVAHRELDAVAVSTEYHPCLGGLRVLGDVVQSLLRDAIEAQGRRIRHGQGFVRHADVDVDTGVLAEVGAV